jgi:hypothetical protein
LGDYLAFLRPAYRACQNDLADTEINDNELLSQLKRAEHLPKEKKKLVKEFLDSFLLSDKLQQKFISTK